VTEKDKFIIADIMTKDLIFIAPDATAKDAANVMIENLINSVIVKENDVVIGIVTDHDFKRVATSTTEIGKLFVREIMSSDPISISPSYTLPEAVEVIKNRNIRHLLVKSPSGVYVGIVSVKDILSTLFEEINIRNKRLQGKIGELEKFYKVAVKRELVMVKLKKRVYELEKKLGIESDLSELLIE